MSTDSAPLVYPERVIRPLPRRRLRERLSPDIHETIKYPPAPQNTAPLFYYPYNLKDESAAGDASNGARRENVGEFAHEGGSRRNGAGLELDEERLVYPGQTRRVLVSRPLHEPSGHLGRMPQWSSQTRTQISQGSTASSVDGYDSFENTNNKKKRKIPANGEGNLNGAHVLNDSTILGLPSPPTTSDEGPTDALEATPSSYYQPGGIIANGQGVSGSGRGRYGRARNGRSPLGTLPDPNGTWAVGRNGKLRPSGQYPSPSSVPPGQENVSLLHQQASSKANTASSQFTFTFDSQVPGTVSWPGSDPAPTHMRPNHSQQAPASGDPRDPHNGVSTRGTQAGHALLSGLPGGNAGVSAPVDGAEKGPAQTNAMPKKSKRRGKSLLQQAKQRRRDTQVQNFHHPPAAEDIWICEFCEYESIFGRPPEALIRQYEIKDRRRKREEAERRRLLEKAKMKSRKGKKVNKVPAKSNAAAQDRNSAPLVEHQAPNQETQSEVYGEDNYCEEDVHNHHCPAAFHDSRTQPTLHGHAGGGGNGSGSDQDNRIPVS